MSARALYVTAVGIYVTWFLFVFAQWLWFHLAGHPFWPVRA